MKTSRHIAGVVADANVLLAAVVGKAALRVFTDFDVKVCATEFNCAEVDEYLPALARRYGLEAELVAIQWRMLAIEVHAEDSYASAFETAVSRVAGRDPDDAHPLALAMTLGTSIWSNDSDLQDCGVACHTTAELLAFLDAAKQDS